MIAVLCCSFATLLKIQTVKADDGSWQTPYSDTGLTGGGDPAWGCSTMDPEVWTTPEMLLLALLQRP